MAEGLKFGPFRDHWVHLCIDMQRMFAEHTQWHTPWMDRILPNVVSLVELDPTRTIFTRFIPAASSDEASGAWRRYYERWPMMTREQLDPELINLLPELARFVPPAQLEDKLVMSAWHEGLHARLQAAQISTLVVTGAETEVCVLATIMGAVDLGYRVIVVSDALCSGADSTHDAMLEIYRDRFGMQVEVATTAELLAARIDGFF